MEEGREYVKDTVNLWIAFLGLLLLDAATLNVVYKNEGLFKFMGYTGALGCIALFIAWHRWAVRIAVRAQSYPCDCQEIPDAPTGRHSKADEQ